MIRQDAGRGALPRDRRRTSAHGEQGHLPRNAPSTHRTRREVTCPQFGSVRPQFGLVPYLGVLGTWRDSDLSLMVSPQSGDALPTLRLWDALPHDPLRRR